MAESRVDRISGPQLAGSVGFLLIVFGGVTTVATDAPTTASVSFVGLGVALFAVATLSSVILRIKVPGSEIELRASADPGQLSQEIEQLRDEKPDPTNAELPGQGQEDGDESLEQVWWETARYLLGERALMALLDTKLEGPLYGCQARLYLYDEREGMLMPAYRPDNGGRKPQGWRIGEGLVGAAYEYNEYTYADGDAIRSDSWGLTEEVLDRYKDLTAGAAAPLVSRVGTVIGVLALSATGPAPRLTTPYGRQEHVAIAQQVSVCLVDLLWGDS